MAFVDRIRCATVLLIMLPITCAIATGTLERVVSVLPSSQFNINQQVIYNSIAAASYLSHRMDCSTSTCPCDVFSINVSTGAVFISKSIDFSNSAVKCAGNIDDSYHVILESFQCFIIRTTSLESTNSVLLVIHVVPDYDTNSSSKHSVLKAKSVGGSGLNLVHYDRTMYQSLISTLSQFDSAVLNYSLEDDSSHSFTIQRESTHCTSVMKLYSMTQQLEQPFYNLTLLVSATSPSYPHIASTPVNIMLEVPYINYHTPLLTMNNINITIPSNTPRLSVIATVSATDGDGGTVPAGTLRYALMNHNDVFGINAVTGQVILLMNDNSLEEAYNVSVFVYDQGVPQKSMGSTIMIFIESSGMPTPYINVTDTFSVGELTPTGTTVLTTLKVENTNTMNISASLLCGTCTDCFQLISYDSNDEYYIMLTQQLNYELVPSYTCSISVFNGMFSLLVEKELTINIEDSNEPPYFTQSNYSISISELSPMNTVVLLVTAYDEDIGDKVMYSINNVQNTFDINPQTGLIYTKGALSAGVILLNISANDGQFKIFTPLSITITPEDKIPPAFSSPLFQGVVYENVSDNEPIFSFVAHDTDSGCPGAIQYSIVQMEPPYFVIDSASGLLYVTSYGLLKYDPSMNFAIVTVKATSLGKYNDQFDTTILNLTILSTNNSPPTIAPIDCPCFIMEEIPSVQYCQELYATDNDGDSVVFQLSSNSNGLFEIHPVTGVVSVVKPVDRESQAVYELYITASDGEHISEPVKLVIQVLDVNDSPPYYKSSSIEISLPQDTPNGSTVGIIKANQDDVGVNALSRHTFSSDTPQSTKDLFHLDPLSGELTLSKSVIAGSAYSFTITVVDLFNDTQVTTLPITIVIGANAPPYFALSEYVATIASNSPMDSTVVTLTASDDDDDDLVYSLDSNGSVFDLNSQTGKVTLQQVPPTQLTYSLDVSATDGLLTSYARLYVHIYQPSVAISGIVYSHNPGVGSCTYTGYLSEGVTKGGEVVITMATAQSGQTIAYAIVGENSYEDILQIDGNSLVSVAGGTTDKTMNEALYLTVRATYGQQLFHLCSVTVIITDINNHGPSFNSSAYSIEIYQATPTDSSVFIFQAMDPDCGDNATITYTLLTNSVPFTVSSISGHTRLTGPLSDTEYILTVLAADGHDPLMNNTATLVITVLSTINTPPMFINPLTSINVQENFTVNSIITTLQVSDVDTGSQGSFLFCLISGTNIFSMNNDGGVILTEPLDYESIVPPPRNITVMAYDTSCNPRNSITTFSLMITDVNDETPIFSTTVYTAYVLEGTGTATPVLTVIANDRDYSINTVLYSISVSNWFSINSSTGTISVSAIIDRESLDNDTISLTVTASDSKGLSSTAIVNIIITDKNDNRPSFVDHTNMSLVMAESMPSGSVIYTVKTTDPDYGLNSLVHYTMNNNDHFYIDTNSGDIVLCRPVDYERDPVNFSLVITAADSGTTPLSTFLTISVTVTNVNDNYPLFTSSVYYCQVNEITNSHVLTATPLLNGNCTINATDNDINSAVIYSIEEDITIFHINEATGTISLTDEGINMIDFDTLPYHIITVIARDNGDPSLSATTQVIINIVDYNDEEPSFDHLTTSVWIPSGIPVGTMLFTSHATDRDTTDQLVGLTYDLLMGTDTFNIDPKTGRVVLDSELSEDSYGIMILASDNGGKGTQATITVTVLSTNTNLNPPYFPYSNNLIAEVVSTAALGTIIYQLNATDSSGNDVLEYYITSRSYFSIDKDNGTVFVAEPLANMAGQEIVLELLVSDGGVPPLYSLFNLTVIVVDDPDTPPVFTNAEYNMAVSESKSGEFHIMGHVLALINDAYNDDVLYYITGYQGDLPFGINISTGAIYVDGSLDRETAKDYSFTIQASLNGVSSMLSHVVVAVSDINDIRPQFASSYTTITLPYTYTIGDEVFRIFAVDKDEGINAVSSFIISPSNDILSINESTGVVSIQTTPTPGIYNYTITVSDSLFDRDLYTSIVITDQLVQLGDIICDNYSVMVTEDTPTGTLIYTMSINNGGSAVFYRLVDDPYFTIHPSTGEVFLTTPLNKEKHDYHNLSIIVWDGVSVNMTICSLAVGVVDVNEYSPKFTSSMYLFSVFENTPINTTVGVVSAIDLDDGPSDLVYKIESMSAGIGNHDDLFTIDSLSGSISLNRTIDHEQLSRDISMIISATDQGNKRSFVSVTVEIIDENDQRPLLPLLLPNITITENVAMGTHILTVKALDKDKFSSTSYALVNKGSVPFIINTTTGEITTLGTIDYETANSAHYNLQVIATDNDNLLYNDTAELCVFIHNEIDTVPVLASVTDTITVRENMPPSTFVASAAAGGGAMPPHAITYTILDDEGLFYIETFTGIIRTLVPLDYEECQYHNISIMGSYNTQYYTLLNVTIEVEDVNDHEPETTVNNFTFTVSEGAMVANDIIFDIGYFDRDIGSNGVIKFVHILDPECDNVFSIDKTGKVTLKQLLDRETEDFYHFEVFVMDDGTPSLYLSHHISVVVEDVNDNAPSFDRELFSFIISTPVIVDQELFQVKASDSDENSVINYKLLNGTETFAIDLVTGVISIHNNLRLDPHYTLTLQATDEGGLNATAILIVELRHCGFRNLTFQPSWYSITVPEDTTPGTLLLSTVINDFNMPGYFYYYIPTNTNNFNINSTTGEIYLQQELDYETTDHVDILLQVRDMNFSESVRIAEAILTVSIADVNDNEPVFINTPYAVFMRDDTKEGTVIFTVKATDADSMSSIQYDISTDSRTQGSVFNVNATSGAVTLSSYNDDTPHGERLELIITASDNGDDPRSLFSNVTLVVTVLSSNAPAFTQPIYIFIVPESTPTGSVINTIQAQASNISNAQLFYSIIDPLLDLKFPFSIHPYNGNLSINDRGIDHEAKNFYEFFVRAEDTILGISTEVEVLVHIEDVNDNAPQFSLPLYTFVIDENTPINTIIGNVSASDEDTPPFAQILFSLSTTDFLVNEINGTIYTNILLDYEEQQSHQFIIYANDRGIPVALQGMASIRVIVNNLNDNPPILDSLTNQLPLVPEYPPKNHFIALISGSDPDGDDIFYDLTVSKGSGNFIVSDDGLLQVRSNVTILPDPSYTVTVIASDGLHTVNETITINILDINDHSPVFAQDIYYANVTEGSPSGVYVAMVTATDDDRGSNAKIQYSGNLDELFIVDSETGVITTSETATDREMNEEHKLIVIGRDGGDRTGTTVVIIGVRDINDNVPQFSQSIYTVFITEESDIGTPVITVSAIDHDEGSNGTVIYSIIGTVPFHINSMTGLISVFGDIDYETQQVLNISVLATDGGGLQSSPATVNINLRNKADANPQFSQDVYEIKFEECPNGCAGVYVTMVNVTYPDQCILESVSIHEGSPSLPFIINSATAIISAVGNIKRINKDFYSFTVLASCSVLNDDFMVDQLFATASVYVTITDTNEPPLAPLLTVLSISEGVPINSTVGVVTGTDNDLGANSTLVYSIKESDDVVPFIIDSVTGEIKTSNVLDRESIDEYRFTVRVSDEGTPSLTALFGGIVVVTIQDENDSPPVIAVCANETTECNFEALLAEGTPIGTNVLTLSIDDPDTINDISFKVSTAVFSFESVVNENNAIIGGVISTVQELDRETLDWYEFEAIVSDGIHTASILISINITDINDQVPVFEETEYRVTINENYPSFTSVLTILAIDNDIGLNAIVSYQLLSTPQLNNLTINSTTGEIFFLESPDHEVSSRIDLLTQASDTGGLFSDTVSIVIDILDLNDNTPEFSADNYTYSISENALYGSDIGYVTASDPDSGNNGLVSYYLNEESSYFQINLVNGLITSKQPLDRESAEIHQVTIVARDNAANTSLSSSVLVTVVVLDDNDNAPVFLGVSNGHHVIMVSEQAVVNEVILILNASDSDIGSNAELSFYLTGNDNDDFAITSFESQINITVAKALNHESITRYDLILGAIDGGIPSQETKINLTIIITDENDNVPMFVRQYETTVSEDMAVGSVIETVEAYDLDSSDHSLIYSIKDDQDTFAVNSSTGSVYINRSLDYETHQQYILTAVASEDNNNPQTAETTITVNVLDVNDNPPMFVCGGEPCPVQVLHVTENQPFPLIIHNFIVTDIDSVSDINTVSFSIEQGDGNIFMIDPLSGTLKVQESLDREHIDEYQLVIAASDNGIPPLTGLCNVTVVVDDVNDNPPIGADQTVYIYLNNGKIGASSFGRVYFIDKDIYNDYEFTLKGPASAIITVSTDGVLSLVPHPLINDGVYPIEINISDTLYNGTETYTVTMVTVEVRNVTVDAMKNSISMVVTDGDNLVTRFINSNLILLKEVIRSYLSMVAKIDSVLVYSVTSKPGLNGIELQMAVKLDNGTYLNKDLLLYYVFVNRSLIEESTLLNVLTEEIDYCSVEPCGKNGLCVVDKYHYSYHAAINQGAPVVFSGMETYPLVTCDCYDSKTGKTCSENKLQCDQIDCGVNGECIESNNVIGCQCDHGYIGESCDIPLESHDLCQSNPCNNGGICTYSHVGFTCTCQTGFTGQTCSQPVNDLNSQQEGCHNNPCLHGGQCTEPVNNSSSHHCSCPEGYAGQECEIFVYNDACPSECDGCIYSSDRVHCIAPPITITCTSSSCSGNISCPEGSALCVDECLPNPCLNGGECIRMFPGYHCVCPDHYGPNCQLPGITLTSRDSRVLLPSLERVTTGEISLELSTLDTSNGTVLYIAGTDETVTDHITVSIEQGYVHCRLSLGNEMSSDHFVFEEFQVNDGDWYTLLLHYDINVS